MESFKSGHLASFARGLFAIVTAMAVLACCGCSSPAADAPSKKASNKDYQFVAVFPIMDNEYWITCAEGVQKADEELGTHTKVIGPATAENFAEEMPKYVQQAIDEKPDVIMMYSGIDGLSDLIDEAVAKGIGVISIDSDAPDSKREAYVGTDGYEIGYKAGETMIALTDGKAKIGVLTTLKGAQKEAQVIDAFKDAISDYDMEVVALEETQGQYENAVTLSRAMLKSHPEITAIFNTGAMNSAGAARTKQSLKLGDLVILGFDDTDENLKLLRRGAIDALLAQQIDQAGYQGVYLMKEYVDNGKLSKNSYDTGTILVTKSNVDTYASDYPMTKDTTTTVKVGYYGGDPSLQSGDSDIERKSGYAYEYLQALATIANWQYEYHYGTRATMLKQLEEGKVDLVAGVHKTNSLKDKVLFSAMDMGLDSTESYFAVSKQREDLLVELDHAMKHLSEISPSFTPLLKHRYYGHSAASRTLDSREKQWLKTNNVLNFGYIRGNLPISDQNADGEPAGLTKDLLDELSSYLQVTLVPICYDNMTDLEAALRTKQIDIAFPIDSDLWLTENNGFRQTNTVVSDRVMVVYDGDFEGNEMEKVAISSTGVVQDGFISIYYPDSHVIVYDTRSQAFDALIKGDVYCVVGCSSALQHYLAKHPEYKDLNVSYLDSSEEIVMATNQSDTILLEALNKAVNQLDPATITSSIMKYSAADTERNLANTIYRYSVILVAILAVFLISIVVTFIVYQRRNREFNRKQEKSQQALREALATAETASNAKTTFLSSMSHNIRTPMNAIVGMTTIATNNIDDKKRVQDCLTKIDLSSRHLLTLINDILDISQIESGRLALNPTVLSLREAITTLVNILEPQSKAKNQEFEVCLVDVRHEHIYSDEVRINQILINILSNAVKYTPDYGRITVTLKEEPLPEPGKARFTYIVADNGIGMTPEFMANMYQTFSRAKDSRINTIQGSGLGLAIVKQMVEMMGGTIQCESQPSVGTTFTITLDLPTRESSDAITAFPDAHLLVIDDRTDYLEGAKGMLQSLNARVDCTASPAEALRMVRQNTGGDEYGVVVVDWTMPGTDVSQLIDALRNEAKGYGKAPKILVAAYDFSTVKAEARGCHADDFVGKLVFRSYTSDKLAKYLGTERVSAAVAREDVNDLGGRRILVAEDNDLNWEVVCALLAMKNIKADRAINGQDCVDKLHAAGAGAYDMVLMDIQMPVMNGREATRAIRTSSSDYVRRIPIVAMTADAFAEDIAANFNAGMNGHVSKPIDIDNLMQEMRRVFSETN